MLERLRRQLSALLESRAAAVAAMEAINAGVTEDRDLNAEESASWATHRAAIAAADADRAPLEERIADLEALEASNAAAAETARRLGDQVPGDVSRARVTGEPSIYSQEQARRENVSFFRDLVNRGQDPQAHDRLLRHAQETRDQITRDVGTGTFTGLVVPQYLTELVAPKRRAGRPVADICNKHELPSSGMTVNISRITTGTAAAAQATENSGVQETDADDTLLTINVRTISGQQDVSRQAIDRGVGVDSIILSDLVAAYNSEQDRQILNSDGTSGTHLSIRSTSGIIAVTYTDSDPTFAEFWPKLADLVQQSQSDVFMGITHFVMHPRRWWWLAAALGTSLPLLSVSNAGTQQLGTTGGSEYTASGRNILGIPVVLDANIPTNLGGGTEDIVLGVTDEELHLWEDPGAPLMVRSEEAGVGSLSVKLVVYGYSAFTAGRYPGAHGKIAGTGLAAPTF